MTIDAALECREPGNPGCLERPCRQERVAPGQISDVLIARYDLFVGPYEGGYLLDLQTNLLDRLKSRVVPPLLRAAEIPADQEAQSGF
ncbi:MULTISPECIES: CcdB family protein [Hyphomicrobiales]|uniref:CcdB family protein n=1 Tax=Hoeflea sp. 108 TaxID=1116369 RepID=UPI001FDAC799|nr:MULTISPECIES: CcdB family protein [Phyllobacteriaceae]MCX8567478.1 CcdB family protein [Aminobacter sp. MET-1]